LSLANDLGQAGVVVHAEASESSFHDAGRSPCAPALGLYIILRTLRI
jgi:hypothetical protein